LVKNVNAAEPASVDAPIRSSYTALKRAEPKRIKVLLHFGHRIDLLSRARHAIQHILPAARQLA
jgi:hypothetical protein